MREVRKTFNFIKISNILTYKILLKFLERNKQTITAHSFTKSRKICEDKENQDNTPWISNRVRGRKPTNISGKNKLNVKRRQEDNDIIKNAIKER